MQVIHFVKWQKLLLSHTHYQSLTTSGSSMSLLCKNSCESELEIHYGLLTFRNVNVFYQHLITARNAACVKFEKKNMIICYFIVFIWYIFKIDTLCTSNREYISFFFLPNWSLNKIKNILVYYHTGDHFDHFVKTWKKGHFFL